MTNSSEIGRYGTLRLLKRHGLDATVAFFPIDDETVTFGRSKQCSVRLYYECVSELHCTLRMSEERKAFLLVHGTNGLLVDGCQVNPSRSPGSGPTTVPLTNGSEIEIYKKRFKFEYPPKDIRAELLATPRNAKDRRSLRMSMIRSAQVFTPRRSADENLRTPRQDARGDMDWDALRSPVKVPSQDGRPEQQTTLLEGRGDDAFVVEEDKDLIVLEKVYDQPQEEVASPFQQKTNRGRSVAFSTPTATPSSRPVHVPQSAQTLRRAPQAAPAYRRRSAPSLHRAVVLRSAQLALQREQERFEEQEEEDEVEAEVSPERELGPLEVGDEVDEDFDHDESYGDDEEGHGGTSEGRPILGQSNPLLVRPARRMTAFRASLDVMRKVIPLPFDWKSPEEVPLPADNDDGQDISDEEEGGQNDGLHDRDHNHSEQENESKPAFQTPTHRNLGPFMTPQAPLGRPQRIPVDMKARVSVGGEGAAQKLYGGAQRVRVVPAWKVTDIALPEPEKPALVEERRDVRKEQITEEERQAIMARRKSALNTPSSLPAPGPRASAFPPARDDVYTPGEDSGEDADTMLEKMRQKMIHIRRKTESRKMRTSIGSGEKLSLLGSSVDRKNRKNADVPEETQIQGMGSKLNEDVTQLIPEATGSNSGVNHDDLDLLETSNHDYKSGAGAPAGLSLTPRFDGVREMFRQPRVEPKTPSFKGLNSMFKEHSEVTNLKTPSFRGLKDMFNHAEVNAGLATPHMDLGELFSEDKDMATDPEERIAEGSITIPQRSRPLSSRAKSTTAAKSEGESLATTSLPKTNTSNRKTAPTLLMRPPRKDGVPDVDVPSMVLEEPSSDQEDDICETGKAESMPGPTVRHAAKRSTKNTITPTGGDASPPESKGRSTSRNARKAVGADLESTGKGIVVHKNKKTGRTVREDSEEDPDGFSGKAKSSGRGKSRKRQLSQTAADPEHSESEVHVATRAGARKAKEIETSDDEEIVPVKPRRGRAVKTPQGRAEPTETTTAKPTRRVKVERLADIDNPVPASRAPRSKRGARTKAADLVDESPPGKVDDDSSEAEADEVPPAPTRRTATKNKGVKMIPLPKDTTVDDKENAESGQSQTWDKTPATRTRRAAVTHVDALDAPAKRTRSRK